jgi:ParB/RepB/Spo0J family partition protein
MADARQVSIVDRLKERAAEVDEARSVAGGDPVAAVAGSAGGPDKVLDSILPAQHLAIVPIDLVSPAREGQARQDFDGDRLKSLADSLRRSGVREPIIVTPHGAEKGHFLIVAGERRWRAAKLAGLSEIPCMVDPHLQEERDKLLAQAEENFHRENLNPVEEAAALTQLMKARDLGAAEAGELLGKSGTQARRLVQLHEAPALIKEALSQRRIDAGAALELIRIHNNFLREDLDRSPSEGIAHVLGVMEKAISERWSIRRLERSGRSSGESEAVPSKGESDQVRPAGQGTSTSSKHRVKPATPPAAPSASPVAAGFERLDDRVVIDVARIKGKALTPQEREVLIDVLEDLLILVRSS